MKVIIDLILTLKTFASDEWFIFTIFMIWIRHVKLVAPCLVCMTRLSISYLLNYSSNH